VITARSPAPFAVVEASQVGEARRQILALKQFFAARQCTVLLLDDKTAPEGDLQLHSLAHGVIQLEHIALEYGAERRRLHAQVRRSPRPGQCRLAGSATRAPVPALATLRFRQAVYNLTFSTFDLEDHHLSNPVTALDLDRYGRV